MYILFKIATDCNDCHMFQKMIADATTEEEKKRIQLLFDSHRLDAELCQDFMYWMFQKAYAQMGRDYQDWHTLETHEENIH